MVHRLLQSRVCGKAPELDRAHGYRQILSEKRQFHELLLEVVSQALIISLEGRRRELLLLLLLFSPFPIRSTLERKQSGTKRQRGPTQKNKSADLISSLCLSLTERVCSGFSDSRELRRRLPASDPVYPRGEIMSLLSGGHASSGAL